MSKRAVFLDRDGTLNKDVGYPSCYSQLLIFPFSFEAVRRINQAGLLAVVMTNQSGVGRGLFNEGDLQGMHRRLSEDFVAHQARLDGIYYCPHYLQSLEQRYRQDCACRKPNTGMALRASREMDIDLRSSFMIGDKVEDVEFGRNMGAVPVLVLTGNGRESEKQLAEEGRPPAYIAATLREAVDWVLKEAARASTGKT